MKGGVGENRSSIPASGRGGHKGFSREPADNRPTGKAGEADNPEGRNRPDWTGMGRGGIPEPGPEEVPVPELARREERLRRQEPERPQGIPGRNQPDCQPPSS